jgi:hypothetical protein
MRDDHGLHVEVRDGEIVVILPHLKAYTPTLQGSCRSWLDCLPLPWCWRWSAQRKGQRCLEAWVLQRGSKGRAPPGPIAPRECLKPAETTL